MATKKWEQKAFGHKKNKGKLRKTLHIQKGETIPIQTLRDIVATPIGKHTHGHKVTTLLKQRALAVLNAHDGRK
jgi:hypothetical protein